ncbi:MAG: TonB-dependent receptor plug domain-containing protein, partial [Gemmatimonadota bacterium]|nr:TonB-dependent receptor plug domain-containing protein [Gemmatimonadota bacterium]
MNHSGGNISRIPLVGWVARAGAVFGLLIGLAAPAMAQSGTVTGRVLNTATGQGIGAVRISVEGTRLATQTRPTGEFTLTGVPVGQQRVVAQGIGYSTVVSEVVVTLNQPVEVNFQLNELVFSMDEIVVTGTAGQARRREIGSSLEQVTAEDIADQPIQDVGDILQGRAAGVTVMDNTGQAGGGNTIRLRGNNSATQGNQPLIYVDGVRITNQSYDGNAEINQASNPLNDINPDDIERVEVVKGAATLYGTEASGGVIQIFTKRGSQGAAQWSFSMDQGVNSMGHVGPDASINPTGLGLNSCDGTTGDELFPVDPSCPESGSWFQAGHKQNYSLSVRGGNESTSYFVSAQLGDEQGVIAPQSSKNSSVRGNFTFQPTDNLQIGFSNFYSNRTTQWIPDGNNAEGLLLNVLRGSAGYTPDNRDGLTLDMELFTFIHHFTTGLNVVWTPGNGMTHRVNVGLDLAQGETTQERPWGFFYRPLGNRESIRNTNRPLTFDYVGTWQKDLGENLTSSFSLGGQLFEEKREWLEGWGSDFAGPGSKVISSAAQTDSWETRQQVVNGGFFLQEMIGINDQLFITGGLRVDGHSSFGENFGLQAYPKIMASYILSDNDFWPEFWETMKIRAAIGSSGKAPGAFDKLRTWASVAGDDGKAGVS